MAKEKDLKKRAADKMETLVEQYNELQRSIQRLQGDMQELNGRLAEVQTEIVKQQGYLKALDDINEKS